MIRGPINSKVHLTGSVNNAIKYITPNLENIEITPSKEEQVFNHPNSDGYDEIKVNGVTNEVDENIVAENIKSDVEILGVKGTFVGKKYAPKYISFYKSTQSDFSYEISNLDISNMTTLDNLFRECGAITTLDLTHWDTSHITSISGIFHLCNNLIELNLSTWETPLLKNINEFVYLCSSLKRLDIRNMTFDNITSKSTVFSSVPTDCLVIVKGETEKAWVLDRRSAFTNVKTVAELGE